jgi:release factor glutamine methyltransferase
MKTVKEVYSDYATALKSIYDTNEAVAIADLVLGELTGFSRAKLKAFTDTILTSEQRHRAEAILAELTTGKPVQYVIGHTDFYSLDFLVNPSVLIPRPETEELVDWIINTAKVSPATAHQVLDIGTGSGCIAISLKKNLPQAVVSAIDISAAALETATENARRNITDVNFIEADILNLKSAAISDNTYSIIVSNPPYVTPADKEQMHNNVTDFEPHTALFVPQDDPLLFYNAIADFAVSHLDTGGFLFFEINEAYGKQIVELLQDKSFINIELSKDMSSRDRMIKAQKLN